MNLFICIDLLYNTMRMQETKEEEEKTSSLMIINKNEHVQFFHVTWQDNNRLNRVLLIVNLSFRFDKPTVTVWLWNFSLSDDSTAKHVGMISANQKQLYRTRLFLPFCHFAILIRLYVIQKRRIRWVIVISTRK